MHLSGGSGLRRLWLVLALAACSSSSSGQGDALGGASGADGAAAGGPSSGTAASDAAVATPGGSYGGGSGGAGGTPSPCADPAFPLSCPAHGDVPALCWSAGTDCSTVIRCGDQFRSCTSANAHYDCTEMHCVFSSTGDGGSSACGDPNFPISCPARGDVPALCWSASTVCSTIGRCGNDFRSCVSAGFHFSCADQRCVADGDGGTSAPPDAGPADAAPADAHD